MLEYSSVVLLIILLFIIVIIFYSSVTVTITDSSISPTPSTPSNGSRPNANIASEPATVASSSQSLLDMSTLSVLSAMFPKFYYDNSQIVRTP
jgi:hypothetical protein